MGAGEREVGGRVVERREAGERVATEREREVGLSGLKYQGFAWSNLCDWPLWKEVSCMQFFKKSLIFLYFTIL